MSAPVQIGDATLYLGDCLEILPTLGKIDAVVTDPPYGIDYQSSWRTDKTARLPKIAGDADLSFMPDFLNSLFDLTPEDAHAYIFCRWDKWPLPAGRWKTKNMVVWDKCQHGTGDLSDGFGPQHELIAFLTKGRRGFSAKRPIDIIRRKKVPPEQLTHSCEKPVDLIRTLIKLSTRHDNTVIDPFMGSGTTGVACAKLGRKFIGIEIEPKYFDIACKRIDAAYKQGDLFIDPPKKAQQPNLPEVV